MAQLIIRWLVWVRCLGANPLASDPSPPAMPLLFLIDTDTTEKKVLLLLSSSDNSEKMFPAFGPHKGWDFKDEDTKYGWIASKTDSEITFSLPDSTSFLIVGFLRSYENIGSVDIAVESSGVKIMTSTLSGVWTERISQYDEIEFALPEDK